jgi:hypothetical protein
MEFEEAVEKALKIIKENPTKIPVGLISFPQFGESSDEWILRLWEGAPNDSHAWGIIEEHLIPKE